MDKRLVIVLIFVVFGLTVLTYGYTQQNQYAKQNNTIQNDTVQNSAVQKSNEQLNVNGAKKDYDAIITQKGPDAPQKRGTSVPIYYAVTNKGKNTIYNAEVGSQDFVKNIDVLKPGETRKYTHMQYIPTNEDLAEWYEGGNVKLTSPLVIGGPKLTFIDDKGVFHSIYSNSIEIKLLN